MFNNYNKVKNYLQSKGYSTKVITVALAYIGESEANASYRRKHLAFDAPANLKDNPFYQHFNKVLGEPLRKMRELKEAQAEMTENCKKVSTFFLVANLSMSWRKLKQSMKRMEAFKPTIAGIRDQLDDAEAALAKQFRSGGRSATVSVAGGLERDYEPVSGPPAIYEEMEERARIRNNAMGVEEIRGSLGNYDNHRN